MPRAIRINETGGPEVMRLEEVDVPAPAAGNVQVQHTAIGLNYIDVYDRNGLYPQNMPGGLGREAAGIVTAVGAECGAFASVTASPMCSGVPGAYCDVRNVPADRLVKIPAGISDEQAAVLSLKGMTACFLLRHCFRVETRRRDRRPRGRGWRGNVSLAMGQSARRGSHRRRRQRRESEDREEERLQTRAGARPRRNRGKREEDQQGLGAHVVYDGVGKDTFFESLDSLRKRGMMVSYGNASGPAPPFTVGELVKRGSLFLTRPTMFDYTESRADIEAIARETFAAVKKGWIKVRIDQRYKLADAAQAHRDLEARKTTGASVIVP